MSYTQYHPIYVDLNDRPLLIVGGGFVAMEKLHSLLGSGARITVVSPDATPEIQAWNSEGKLSWVDRKFQDSDVDGFFMVIAATNDPATNARIFLLGNDAKKLTNSVDDPVNCNFIMAAIVKQGPMQVAVSSAGCSPALAQRVRNRVAGEILSEEMGELADYLGSWRSRVKESLPTYKARQNFWETVIDSDLPAVLAGEGHDAADRLLTSMLKESGR